MNASSIEAIITGLMFIAVLMPLVLVGGVLLVPFCTAECDTPSGRYPYTVLKVVAIVLLFALAAARMAFVSSREYFLEHFDEYKCKPWFMPFVSQVNPAVSASENYKKCYDSIGMAMAAQLTAPLVDVTSSIGAGLNNTATAVADANLGVKSMTTAVSASLERTQSEVSGYHAVVMYLFLKIKAMFDKSMVTLLNFYYALISLLDLVNVLLALPEIMRNALRKEWHKFIAMCAVASVLMATLISSAIASVPFAIPVSILSFSLAATITTFFFTATILMAILDAVYVPITKMYDAADGNSYCCFAPQTPVVMQDGTLRKIDRISIGDTLQDGVRVRGVMRVESAVDDWFEFGSAVARRDETVIVSGGHTFWDAAACAWVQVDSLNDRRSVRRLPPGRARPPERICLVTDTHCIPTPDGWFADFQESDDARYLAGETLDTLKELNSNMDTDPLSNESLAAAALSSYLGESQSGLDGDALVVMAAGVAVRVADVRKGDALQGGGTVIGTYVVQMSPDARGHHIRPSDSHEQSDGHHIRPSDSHEQSVWLASDQIYFDAERRCWITSAFSKSDPGGAVSPPFSGPGYHLISTSGYFHIRHAHSTASIKIRDFIEKPGCKI